MKCPVLTVVLAAGCCVLTPLSLAQSDSAPPPPSPEQRDLVQRIEKEVRVLRPEERPWDVEKPRAELRWQEGPRGPDARPGAEARRGPDPAVQAEVRELRMKRAQLMEKLERIRQEASPEDLASMKQRIAEVDRRMAELAAARAGRAQSERPRVWQEGRPVRGPVNPEAERRLEHLAVAIENLHAAGLHEPAERLAREREEMAQQFRQGPEGGPDRAELAGEVRRLRAELDEVRQALGMLKARIEELHRERR